MTDPIRARLDELEYVRFGVMIRPETHALRAVLDLQPAWQGHCSGCDAIRRVIAQNLGVTDA